MEWKTKKAILFDLGGVLINLDYQQTEDAFIALGLTDFRERYSQLAQTDLFDRFETGQISAFHFVNRLLDMLPSGINANQVVHAWNAMILDFPAERLKWLESLKDSHALYLLSNTNELHIPAVRRSLEKSVGHQQLEHYFHETYFSSEIKRRKPDVTTFEWFLDQTGLQASEVLFIDDSPQHIAGAKAAGIESVLLEKGRDVRELFAN